MEQQEKKGVMIVNLGTPSLPNKKEVRLFLKKFLSDKRVIDLPRFVWLPILHGIILNVRPKKSAKLYQEIWQEEGSPLKIYTEAQQKSLQKELADYSVKYAMSYSNPTIEQVLAEFDQQKVDDLTVIPLYPQYSTTTTASIYDCVTQYYQKKSHLPTLHFINDYCDHPLYIELLIKQIKKVLVQEKIDLLLFSYHGIPVSYVTKGDDYPNRCNRTTKAVMSHFTELPYQQTFQSKFGPSQWLTPATDETLKKLPSQGIKKIAVITPGFVSDCLETIEEIESENKGYFIDNGGETFHYIHPFNADPDFSRFLAQLV